MRSELAGRLRERADLAGLTLEPALSDTLLTYYELLGRWNAKINLTSLSDPDEAIDRLLLEPVAAASALPRGGKLMDLGSGGGSPAIPLAAALSASQLVMVESRGRKAAFLREAARALPLPVVVEAVRFEDLAKGLLSEHSAYLGRMDVVSMRAIRMDRDALSTAVRFLDGNGALALFVSRDGEVDVPPGFRIKLRRPLVRNAELVVLSAENVPRGTIGLSRLPGQ